MRKAKKASHITAMRLELIRDMIYRWVNEYESQGNEAFSGEGNVRRHDLGAEITKLN